MDVIRIRLGQKRYKPPNFTVKIRDPYKSKLHSKYGVVRFITKLIKRTEPIITDSHVIRPMPKHSSHVVKFLQIWRNKFDTIDKTK